MMKLQNCCAGCSEPFPAKLVQDAPGKGRHSSRTASLITSLPSRDWEPYLAESRKPFWPISRELLSATWITPATNVGVGEASRFPGTSHLAAVVDMPFLCSPGFESRTAFSVFSIKAGSVSLAGFMEKKKKKKPPQNQKNPPT